MSPETRAPQLSNRVNALFFSALCALLTPNSMLVRAGDPDDSSVFAYIGWLMKRGYRPYRDVWDHKGPVLYYLNWVGWSITPTTTVGIGLLQAAVYFAAFFCLLRLLQQAGIRTGPFVCTAVFSVSALAQVSQGGNMAETWALGAIAISHFVAFNGFRGRLVLWHFIALGAAFSICFWIRPNLCPVPALALLVMGHVQRLRRGFVAGFLALGIAACTILATTLLTLAPILLSGTAGDFRDAYFGYNSSYSRFTSLHDHVAGALTLLLTPKTMALALLAVCGWALVLRSKLNLPSFYRHLLLVSFPLEFLAAAISGRAYFHYLAAVWPTALILAGVGAQAIVLAVWRPRRTWIAVSLLATAAVLEVRRYALFEWKAVRLDPAQSAVAEFIDAETRPSDRILPVGDVAATATALRSRREPSGRFIYQLAMAHRANAVAELQQREELQSISGQHPRIIFSMPGMVGSLCGSPDDYQAEAANEGYDYGRMRQLVAPVLAANYRRVQNPSFGSACVYELR